MGETVKKLHLKLPTAMLGTLRPTGCRTSPEAEAAWRLAAAIVVVRETKERGLLPISKDALLFEEATNPEEIHISLNEDDINFLTEISEKEGGSRGELVRKLLMTAQKEVDGFPCSLTFEGLISLIRRRFSNLKVL